jgi:hypothetical protein
MHRYQDAQERRSSMMTLEVLSPHLRVPVWVVADRWPRDEWPQDGTPVYLHSELNILMQVGLDALVWVHPIKEVFGATVVGGHSRTERREPDNHQEAVWDGRAGQPQCSGTPEAAIYRSNRKPRESG